MSQRDNFAGGFFAGALIGSLVGGIVGAALASQRNSGQDLSKDKALRNGRGGNLEGEEGLETARRTLEDKIAQLNVVIDDVRQELGEVNEKKEDLEGN